jgi:hypothetical protein
MIGGIFYAFDNFGFIGLISIRKFFDALIVCVCHAGKILGVAGLAGAVRAYLAGISTEIIEPSFIVIPAISVHVASSRVMTSVSSD